MLFKLRDSFKNYTIQRLVQSIFLLGTASLLLFYSYYDKISFNGYKGIIPAIIWITLLSYMLFGNIIFIYLLFNRFCHTNIKKNHRNGFY